MSANLVSRSLGRSGLSQKITLRGSVQAQPNVFVVGEFDNRTWPCTVSESNKEAH